MLGSNPSADSVASTDAGGCYGIPLSPSAYRNPYRERQQSVKSWGCGGKAPACGAGTQASSDVRALSHNASGCIFGGIFRKVISNSLIMRRFGSLPLRQHLTYLLQSKYNA
jgi:hypothetical protein